MLVLVRRRVIDRGLLSESISKKFRSALELATDLREPQLALPIHTLDGRRRA
jgi:hypothetical protein